MKRFSWIVIWFVFILLEFTAQLSSKLAADSLNLENPANWLPAFVATPWLWVAWISSFMSFFIWISILRKYKLSFAFLASSFCYVLVMLAGWIWFHEKIMALQIIGSIFIVYGISLLSKIDSAED